MLYVQMKNGHAVAATIQYPTSGNCRYENRNDWKSFERAQQIAADLTEATGQLFVATDSGPNVSPRYDVIEAPKVGDKVSSAFNGDYYPEGVIVRVSSSLKRVETDTGAVYFRRRKSGAWVKDRTWSMVQGHISRLNPSF